VTNGLAFTARVHDFVDYRLCMQDLDIEHALYRSLVHRCGITLVSPCLRMRTHHLLVHGSETHTRVLPCRYPGLWPVGATATIAGRGSVSAPIVILFDSTGRVISTQREHLELVAPTPLLDGPRQHHGDAVADGDGAERDDDRTHAYGSSSSSNGGGKGDGEGSCTATGTCEESGGSVKRGESSTMTSGGGDSDTQRYDHYSVLGDLPADFTPEELRRAYRKASVQHHPDVRGGSTEMFQRVAEAHRVLSDPVARAAYERGEVDGAAVDESVRCCATQMLRGETKCICVLDSYVSCFRCSRLQ
jgi:hypothetical protein